MKPRAGTLLRWTVGVTLLLVLGSRLEWNTLSRELGTAVTRPGGLQWLLLALTTTFAALCTGAYRWHGILHAMGYPQPFSTTFRWLFMGQFFNIALPGSCGGDALRAWLVGRQQPSGKRAEAFATVLADRGLGLALTAGITALVIISWGASVVPTGLLEMLRTGAMIGALGLLVAAVIVTLLLKKRQQRPRTPKALRVINILERLFLALDVFRHRPLLTLRTLLLSAANLALLGSACWAIGQSLQVPADTQAYLVLFPLITLLAAIPITPGGLGLRESLYVALFGWVGTPPEQALALSLLFLSTGLSVSLLGGIFWMADTPTRHAHQQTGPGP